MTTYHCIALTSDGKFESGMYTRGERSTNPDLAKQLIGNISQNYKRLAVVEQVTMGTWTDSGGNTHERFSKAIVVEIFDR